ncbi:hypothetical protein Nepgr_019542 [Nepenthes gracilis]|uniref:Uncharacterized protein n=1 Tax=Nepenthes gracilis TaxID=150966 RepID=A0AAD3XVG0_NEPGR|nr:hypothetical protein Nepgr_019542 [Nepenthes gracilis]
MAPRRSILALGETAKAWLKVSVNDAQILHLVGFKARNNGTQNPSPNRAYGLLNLPFSFTALFMARASQGSQRSSARHCVQTAPLMKPGRAPVNDAQSFQQNAKTTLQWHLPPPPSFPAKRGIGLSMASPRCSPQTDCGPPLLAARVLGRVSPKMHHEASWQVKA